MFVTSHTFILYTRLNFYILRHIGTIGRKFKNDAWIDLRRKLKNPQSPKNWTRQVVKLSDYSKGHLRTRRKGLIDMIRNHFLLYIRTQLVLICINLNFSATKIPNRKYQIECKKESAKANWKIFSLKQFFTQVFFGGTQIRKLSILSKRQANHVLFWKKKHLSFDLLLYYTSEWIIMLQKLRNLKRFSIPYLVTTFKTIANCETKRKGSFLACKIQDPFILECIGMILIHYIPIRC